MLNVTLNENEIVKSALDGKIDNYNISVVLDVLLKHYYIKGMIDRLQLREQLLDFLKNNYKGYKRPKWEEMITKKVNMFLKITRQNKVNVKLIDIYEIPITKDELSKVNELDDIKLEKLAFVMLVSGKISNIIMNSELGWINKSCTIICKEAKVNLKGDDKTKIFNELYNKGYIEQWQRNDKTNMKVCYIKKDSEVEMVVKDFDCVINYYILWKNKNMIPCEECGKPIVQTNNKKKYCVGCARKIKGVQDRAADIKYKEKLKNEKIEIPFNPLL